MRTRIETRPMVVVPLVVWLATRVFGLLLAIAFIATCLIYLANGNFRLI